MLTGQKEKLDGIGKFVQIWQKKEGEWKISRVIRRFAGGFATAVPGADVCVSYVPEVFLSSLPNFSEELDSVPDVLNREAG